VSSVLLLCTVVLLASVSLRSVLTPMQEVSGKQQPAVIGAALFKEKGCAYCHGEHGAGTERGPSLLSAGLQWKRTMMEQQIREGGGAMPAFGDALSEAELQGLLDYLAAKKAPVKPKMRKGAGH
jgi:mono/diheme cytochrome c family protein